MSNPSSKRSTIRELTPAEVEQVAGGLKVHQRGVGKVKLRVAKILRHVVRI